MGDALGLIEPKAWWPVLPQRMRCVNPPTLTDWL